MNGLHTELTDINGDSTNSDSRIQRIFKLQRRSDIVCETCKTKSLASDSSYMLQPPIVSSGQGDVSLDTCLGEILDQPEKMT